MSRQSYKIHLELIHGDTSGNLREHGVKDISSMFVRREPEKVVEEEEPDISEGSRERSRSPIRRSRSKSTSSSDSSPDRRANDSVERERSQSIIKDGERRKSRSESSESDTRKSDERVQELEEKLQKLMEKQEWIEDIMDVIGNKVDTMALKAGINVNVNDCKNNGYKILLKQVVALENVLEVKQSVERLDQCLKELKLTCEPPKLVDEVKYKSWRCLQEM